MKVLEKWAKFLGIVRTREIGNQVRITGIDGLVMQRYIKRIWETDAINKMMFTSVTDTSLMIHRFFIPDLLYMLEEIKHDKKCGWAGRRTIDKIIHGIMNDTWFKITTQPFTPMTDPKRQSLLKWNAMPKQLEFLHMFGDKMPRYDLRGYILALAPGGGKAQSLDSLILTPSGWVKMGDVKLGDRVSTPDGVGASVTGVYPQGTKDIYRVVLVGGKSAECCKEHLWKVWSPSWDESIQVKQLQDFMGGTDPIFIPMAKEDGTFDSLVALDYVEYVGKKEAQCIAIDHPDHLYITDDYIVTHNTFTDLLVATCVIPPSVAEIKIIISPKKAIHLVWEKSIKQVFKKIPSYWVCDSGVPMPLDKCEYYIFNFEALDKAIALGHQLNAKGKRYFVIVDESHNFADYRSNRTQKLVQLQTVRDDVYFIWTSGSPILKMGAELISFLKCADPRFDSDAERIFRRIFSADRGKANLIFQHRLGLMMAFIVGKSAFSPTKPVVKELPVKLPASLSNTFLMSSVREEMKSFIAQRLVFYSGQITEYRKTVDKWLDYHAHQLKSHADRKQFEKYKTDLKVIMRHPDLMMADLLASTRTYERTKLFPSIPPLERRVFRQTLSAVKNIKLKVRGEALGTILSKRRSECAAALGVYCKPEVIMKESLSKTLFFASSVLPVRTLYNHLDAQGFEARMVYAGTNADLVKIMDEFESDPNINPVIATMQSLSEAVPVIAASTVVLLNRPFREATWSQVVSRADRLGQIHPVTIVEVTLDTGDEPNVSSTTDAILATVRELINGLVGPDFAGPDPNEREYKDLIDASEEDASLLRLDEQIGLE